MTYPEMKMLMKKLDSLINSDDDPLITNHPSMLFQRPQIKLLYEDLRSTFQTVSVEQGDDLQELEEVADEVRDVADEKISNFIEILYKMAMESYPTTESRKIKPAAAGETSSCSRNSLRLRSNKVLDDIVVGLDHDVRLIRRKLTEDTRKLDVVSIVGMGGIGKTTLATKVFNDRYVGYHFNIRGWVTVSQTFEKTGLLNQILASIGIEIDPDQRDNYSYLRGKLHRRLMGQRYLVVIDDIWNKDAWDVLKVVFPDNNNGSRLLLTSRDKRVARHAKKHGFVHQLRCLTVEESWELLCKKVFHGHQSPDSLSGPGMQIARNCRGLPLALVVTAGVLAKETLTQNSWEGVSQSGSLLTVEGNMQSMALSLNHLPSHLRDCFLYLGGFPEDHRFGVTKLIWLWIAEGFIQETKNRNLEETAKDYLMELVDRNLVIVHDRKFGGAIKTFSVHDILRELCLEVATKEKFCVRELELNNCIIAPYKTSRIFIGHDTKLCYSNESFLIHKCIHSWRLLTVLDLKQCHLKYFPEEISLLVHLRYLAFHDDHWDFQSTICHLLCLQFLIIESNSCNFMILPSTISKLVNLRHWRCPRAVIFPPLEKPMMNLQTISNVVLGDGPKSWVKYFPVVKKLSCFIYLDRKYNFKPLTFLEMLKIRSIKSKSIPRFQKNSIRFPASLKKLTLQGCRLPWSFMSRIQSLPNLEVLNLLKDAFMGHRWDAGEEPFQHLRLLKLEELDIQQWKCSSFNFPCLKQLSLGYCKLLEGIPVEMGYIPTLKQIEIECCRSCVTESAYEIREEQRADGNFVLKIISDILSSWIVDISFTPLTYKKLIQLNRVWKSLQLDYLWNHVKRLRRLNINIFCRLKITSTSINLLAPHELKKLGLPINPPVIPANHGIHRSTIWNDGRSRYRPNQRKNIKGRRTIRLLQY